MNFLYTEMQQYKIAYYGVERCKIAQWPVLEVCYLLPTQHVQLKSYNIRVEKRKKQFFLSKKIMEKGFVPMFVGVG